MKLTFMCSLNSDTGRRYHITLHGCLPGVVLVEGHNLHVDETCFEKQAHLGLICIS